MRWLHRLHFELSYILGAAPWDRGVSPPELIAFLDSHPPGRALAIGCGTGTDAPTRAGGGGGVAEPLCLGEHAGAGRAAGGAPAAAFGLSVRGGSGDASRPRSL